MAYHVPALLAESIEGLSIKPEGTYIDLTFGGGGHSREIIKHLSRKGRLIAFDQDKEAFANKIEDKRFRLIHGNFRYYSNYLKYYGVNEVNGVLADLGVSSYHFDSPQRGFSFRHDGPLDMRMNRDSQLTARQVVNQYQQNKLQEIFSVYGELPNAKRIADLTCKARAGNEIGTISDFVSAIQPALADITRNKMLAKIFQAIRIEVNREMEALEQMLLQSENFIVSGGRLVVISYHSLEDRLVKNFIRSGNFKGDLQKDFYGNVESPFRQVNRKIIIPSAHEMERNTRSRSAKLRIGERV